MKNLLFAAMLLLSVKSFGQGNINHNGSITLSRNDTLTINGRPPIVATPYMIDQAVKNLPAGGGVTVTTDASSTTQPFPAFYTRNQILSAQLTATNTAIIRAQFKIDSLGNVIKALVASTATSISATIPKTTADLSNTANFANSNYVNNAVSGVAPTTDITSTTKPLTAAGTNSLITAIAPTTDVTSTAKPLAAATTKTLISAITPVTDTGSVSPTQPLAASATKKIISNLAYYLNPSDLNSYVDGRIALAGGGSGSGPSIIVPTYSNITATGLTATWPNPGGYFNKLIESTTPDLLTNPVAVYSGTGATYNVTGLTAGTQYFFGVQPVYASAATTAAAAASPVYTAFADFNFATVAYSGSGNIDMPNVILFADGGSSFSITNGILTTNKTDGRFIGLYSKDPGGAYPTQAGGYRLTLKNYHAAPDQVVFGALDNAAIHTSNDILPSYSGNDTVYIINNNANGAIIFAIYYGSQDISTSEIILEKF